MCDSAQATVTLTEDDLPPDLELPGVPKLTTAEVRLLVRVDPGLAHERIARHNMAWAKVTMADLKRLEGRDDLQRAYLKTVVDEQQSATEAAWDEYQRLLERASAADIRRAAEAHNRLPMFHSFHAVSNGAEAVAARPRPSARPGRPRYDARPRIRRASARRAAGARSSPDPG